MKGLRNELLQRLFHTLVVKMTEKKNKLIDHKGANRTMMIGYNPGYKRGRRFSSLKFHRLYASDFFESHVLLQKEQLFEAALCSCNSKGSGDCKGFCGVKDDWTEPL